MKDDLIMLYSILMILFSGFIFALAHSLLATNRCKQLFVNHKLLMHHYRFAYVVISIITTVLWLMFIRGLPDVPLFQIEGVLAWALRCVQLMGLLVLYASLRPIDIGVFLGFRSFPEGLDPFIEKGIYRYVRHPMYLGIMIILFAMPQQSINSLMFYLVICVYLVLGSKFEERRLMRAHIEYIEYCRRVPAFIPWIKTPEKQ